MHKIRLFFISSLFFMQPVWAMEDPCNIDNIDNMDDKALEGLIQKIKNEVNSDDAKNIFEWIKAADCNDDRDNVNLKKEFVLPEQDELEDVKQILIKEYFTQWDAFESLARVCDKMELQFFGQIYNGDEVVKNTLDFLQNVRNEAANVFIDADAMEVLDDFLKRNFEQ